MVRTSKGSSIQNYVEAAKWIEKEFGVRTSVVVHTPKSEVPWLSGGKVSIIIVEPLKNKNELVKTLRKNERTKYFNIASAAPITELVRLTVATPGLIENGLGGTGFLAPAFHHEVHGNYFKELKSTFEKKFGEEFRNQVRERTARLKQSKETYLSPTKRMAHEEITTKLVGRREARTISKGLEKMTQDLIKIKPEVLVVLDTSGRPIGREINFLLKKLGLHPKVFFIDPRGRKYPYLGYDYIVKDPAIEEKTKALFEKECPGLVRALKGAKVALIDDQVYKGTTYESMKQLLRQYSPKLITTHHLNEWGPNPEISWRRQGISEVTRNWSGSFRVNRALLEDEQRRIVKGLRKNMRIISTKTIPKIKRRIK